MSATTGTFDWRTLAPDPAVHDCNCGHCDLNGTLEPVEWPVLVRFPHEGTDYVTNRFVALRADLAPVPDGYQGVVLDTPGAPSQFPTDVTDQPPPSHQQFRVSVLDVIEAGGWRLRVLNYPPDCPTKPGRRALGVTDARGALVGWAVPAWTEDPAGRFAREYVEPTTGAVS